MSLAQSEKALRRLTNLLDSSEDSFRSSVPGIERRTFAKVQVLLKELDLKGTTIKQSAKNLRKINRIKREIQNAILSEEYINDVSKFTETFNTATKLQTEYFVTLQSNFTQPKFINTLLDVTIANTTEALTEAGIRANVVDVAGDIIRNNIAGGNSFRNLNKEIRTFLTKTEESVGALQRHTTNIVIDSLNTYAREYSQVVSDDLNSQWFLYVGALVKNSRDFCIALVKKKFIHKSEFTQITKGNIDVDNDGDTEKVSLDGLKPNTNASNFQTLAGGFSCNHVVAPINEEFVPKKIRKNFE